MVGKGRQHVMQNRSPVIGTTHMGQSIVECELLTGTRSAEGIMASGRVSRTDRPNTWLLRPALQRDQSLDSPEPSTHGPKPTFHSASATFRFRMMS